MNTIKLELSIHDQNVIRDALSLHVRTMIKNNCGAFPDEVSEDIETTLVILKRLAKTIDSNWK